jgi:DNA helicase-2/ATP-dependent DNA helicase PcrA
MLVLAGAGSGKTRVLTLRIARLIERDIVPPWRILAVTFTNKAALEMRDRVDRVLPGKGRDCWVSTFHSTCVRILRREIEHLEGFNRDFVIYDDRDSKELVKRVMKDANIPTTVNPRAVSVSIDRAKNDGLNPQKLAEQRRGDQDPRTPEIYRLYQDRLRAANAIDFGDLLLHVLTLFETNAGVLDRWRRRFPYLLVDEYQDTNHVQYRLVHLLGSHGENNVCVVGDEDQSIYSFRGADIRNILDFERDFPGAKVVRLEQNYRSTQTILSAGNAVVQRNTARKGKTLWTDKPVGEPIRVQAAFDDREEARSAVDIARREIDGGLRPRDIAVFYRTNSQSRLIEEEFLASRLPFVLVGGQRFYDRKEVKDLLGYLKLILNPRDEVSLARVINNPPRGIGAKTLATVLNHAASRSVPGMTAVAEVADGAGKATARARKALASFRDMMKALRDAADTFPLHEVATLVLDKSGYAARLQQEQSFEADQRLDNLQELVRSTMDYADAPPPEGLSAFLERTSLVAQTDKLQDGDDLDEAEKQGKITLMTVHSAKGLEFPVVVVIGMDEGLFPHSRASTMLADLEEERRLAYVAITRAQERLYLLRARRRPKPGSGEWGPAQPSRFLREIPRELLTGALPAGGAMPRAPAEPSVPGDSYVEYDGSYRKRKRTPSPPPPRNREAFRSRFNTATPGPRPGPFVAPSQESLFGKAPQKPERLQRRRRPSPPSPTWPTRTSTPRGTETRPEAAPGWDDVVYEPDEAEIDRDDPGMDSDEPRIVRDVPEDLEGLVRVGARVLHPTLGEGEIRRLDGPPQNRRAVVFFKRTGKKTLYLRSAELEILGG